MDYSFLYSNGKISSSFVRRAKRDGKLAHLFNVTSHLPEDSPVSERLYHYENGMNSIPKCVVCEKNLSFINDNFKGYKETCSVKCTKVIRQKKKDQEFSFLPEEALKYKDRLSKIQIEYFKQNPKLEWPLCECGCGEKVLLDKTDTSNIFRRFASPECSRKSKTVPKEILKLLEDKEWLKHQREVLKKSKEQIAYELNISTMPVVKWCIRHGIDIRLNESNSDTKLLLNDKEWLYEQHVINNKTCEDIAEMIGSSKATVSIFLSKHGIETNNPNECERKHVYVSKGCQEIIDYIKEIYDGRIVVNDRSVLRGKELDIYIPDKNFAIEYNGVWSHLYRPYADNESLMKGRNYHKDKTVQCRDKNIFLLQVWSTQWEEKKDILKSIIKQKLGLCSNKIYARKCEIRNITTYDKNIFLESNHLQGKDKSLFKYGLYHTDILIAVMTFCKSRFNKSYQWELSRYSVKSHINVVGGFSKLLSYFKRKNEGSIISYADMMYSNGNVYIKNGFDLLHENPASYWYVKRGTENLEHRTNYRKNFISKENDNRTEEEIMDSLGFDKIFDCGTLVFVMK